MAGSCAGLAVLVGTFDAAGSSLSGSYPRASPFFGVSRIDGEADKHSHTTGGPGELGWREERERRRNAFFKVRERESAGFKVATADDLFLLSDQSIAAKEAACRCPD